jgi:hypothetical protein
MEMEMAGGMKEDKLRSTPTLRDSNRATGGRHA